MTPQDLLLMVFGLIEDELKALTPDPLRPRGPHPTLADSEVLTVELVGESRGLADDRAIYRYFRTRHAAELPALPRVHRTAEIRRGGRRVNATKESPPPALTKEQSFDILNPAPEDTPAGGAAVTAGAPDTP